MHDLRIMEAVAEEEVDPLGTVTNLIHFRFGAIVQSVFSENLLAQKFVKLLFTNPNKNFPDGGGILTVIPETMSTGLVTELKPKVALAISRAEKSIITQQIGTTLSQGERLSTAQMIDLVWDGSIRVLTLTMRITSMRGDVWIVQLPLASG